MIPESLLKEYKFSILDKKDGELTIRMASGKVVTISRIGGEVKWSPGIYSPEEIELLNKLQRYL